MDINGTTQYYPSYQYTSVLKDGDAGGLHGAKRVVLFFLLTVVLPSVLVVLPLYLRHVRFADVVYSVSESDVIQIHDGQSALFCQKHSLKMNSTFHAFQMKGTPEISNRRKHIRLKKSMSLPDDTLEYWGFFLLRGATVELQGCSRYDGSRLLVVRGDKVLDTCGIMDYHDKVDPSLALDHGHVVVTLETPAELVEAPAASAAASAPDTAAERTSEEDDLINDLERAQLMARTRVNKSTHHIKFTVDRGSMQEKGTADGAMPRGKRERESTAADLHELLENGSTRGRRGRDVAHKPHHLLDRGYNHGGNAQEHTTATGADHQSSMSSFENSLLQCYDGNIVTSHAFPYSEQCKSIKMINKTTTLKITHNVSLDGYYYYIFYSDNDLVQNDMHAIFDIYKPTFQYANLSDSKVCINKTECEFPINVFSGELVIVEVPTTDGIEHEEDSSFKLTSTCHPRVQVYVIFPVAVMFLILLCGFL